MMPQVAFANPYLAHLPLFSYAFVIASQSVSPKLWLQKRVEHHEVEQYDCFLNLHIVFKCLMECSNVLIDSSNQLILVLLNSCSNASSNEQFVELGENTKHFSCIPASNKT
eukprot:c49435_g1_i1.p2 GENE.c49435_g1_i1~~c49435_g1_i1.p2  ORF type:complete len:111 (+),score=8.68 c49435_g1_i1:602-934(+)